MDAGIQDFKEADMQVFPSCESLEIYPNGEGGVTLKQHDQMQQVDAYIFIPAQHISSVCKALRVAAREAAEPSNE